MTKSTYRQRLEEVTLRVTTETSDNLGADLAREVSAASCDR